MLTYQGYGGVDGTLAGSKHMFTLETRGGIERILHDCGNNMARAKGEEDNTLPFEVNGINAAVFGHAHFDHVGDIHKLHRAGFIGPYFAQDASADLIKLQLQDAASHEYWDVRSFNASIRGRRGPDGKMIPFRKRSFGTKDVHAILDKFNRGAYGETVQVSPNVRATFLEAGHIIGSAQVLYEFNDNGKPVKVLCAFDLGRTDIDTPIINYPEQRFPGDIDWCLIESTYGGQKHANREESKQELEEVLSRGIKDKKRILIGAFSIMRTHAILSDMYQMYKKGLFPEDFKIYLDSPSAQKVNSLIMQHRECMDQQARRDFADRRNNPFCFPNLRKVRTVKESESLDNMGGPYAIMSASGMWFMGRIVRHLKHHIEDPNALLVQTGYQVSGCIGRELEDGKEKHPKIRIDERAYDYKAEQFRMQSYGAHADGEECVAHVTEHVKPRKGVFVVHGDAPQQKWMEDRLKGEGLDTKITRLGKEYRLS